MLVTMVSIYNSAFQWRRTRGILIGLCGIAMSLSLFIYISSTSNFTGKYRKTAKYTSIEYRMHQRRQHLVEKCQSIWRERPKYTLTSQRIMYFEPKKMAMCYVPKTGCTFWKQVFFYLQGKEQNDPNPKRIFENKLLVHYKPLPRLMDIESFDRRYGIITRSEKIIFVRDPYTRLFSAYVDKILLPEFWSSIGVEIVRQTRKNPEPLAQRCGHDVTFKEFLRRVVLKAKEDVIFYGDEHWFPISKSCLPCTFRYTIIGKQETFESDREWILERFGIADVLPQKRVWEDKIADAVAQSFRVCFQVNPDPTCKSKSMVAGRLLKSLKLQGYIANSVPLSALFLNKHDVNVDKFMSVFHQMAPSALDFRERRHKAFIKAYRDIPNGLLAEIREAFADDFLLFDYDPKPSEIYSYRHSPKQTTAD